MDEVQAQGAPAAEVRDSKGRVGTAAVELRYRRIRVLPPIGKQKRYPALVLTISQAQERVAPTDRPAIDGKLITDLAVTSREAVIEKLRWYALRWKIQMVLSVLKRRWGESLSARRDDTQRAQALLRGLVYNLNRLVRLGLPA
jgi:hypothetical protein